MIKLSDFVIKRLSERGCGGRWAALAGRFSPRVGKVMTIQDAGTLMLLCISTVKKLNKKALGKVQTEIPLDSIIAMVTNEIAVSKGQNYWTMISDMGRLCGPELLNVVDVRKENDFLWCWTHTNHFPL